MAAFLDIISAERSLRTASLESIISTEDHIVKLATEGTCPSKQTRTLLFAEFQYLRILPAKTGRSE